MSFLVLGGVVLAAPHGAMAQTNDTTVVNSGDDADIDSSSSQSSSVVVNNSNTAEIVQTVNADANTGGNDANRNIGGGTSINTGSAGVTANMGATANSNTTAVSGAGVFPSSSNTTDVVNTGDDIDVDTNTNTTSAVQVNNSNAAAVNQSCGGMFGFPDVRSLNGGHGGCSANTGYNDANRNIGGASINTGNAGVTTNFGVNVNQNRTLVGGSLANGPQLVNDVVITNTGDDADVDATANSSSYVGVNNLNSAYISQYVMAHSNTGKNDANRNIGGASIHTGNAGVLANLGINANSNLTAIGGHGLFGSLFNNILDVVNTGDDLDVDTSVNTDSSAEVFNENALMGYQMAYTHSNSGYSDALRNVGYSTVNSGSAGIGANMGVQGNTNSTFLGGLLAALFGLFGF